MLDHMDADIGGYNIILEENKSGSNWSDYLKNFDRSVFLKKLEQPGNENNQDTGKTADKEEKRENKDIHEEGEKQSGLF